MIIAGQELQAQIARINRIPIIGTMLEVVCKTTGMGFAAIARVTDSQWIACSVRDQINFGLQPGGELPLESTICNDIRVSRQPVIIEHVSNDEVFCQHHTPKIYRFESYISFPIFRRDGTFFGTLCAIDPEPRPINDGKISGLFTLFADLLSFHLDSMDILEESQKALAASDVLLKASNLKNSQFTHLTDHSLMEPVRKILLFTDILLQETLAEHPEKVRESVELIRRLAMVLADRIRPLQEQSTEWNIYRKSV